MSAHEALWNHATWIDERVVAYATRCTPYVGYSSGRWLVFEGLG